MTGRRPKQRVFVDASVWVAASASPSGGSSLVLEICRGKRHAAVCTQRVLMEAQTNIRHKLPQAALVRFYDLLASIPLEVLPEVDQDQEHAAEELVAPKDAHVLAAATAGQVEFLISLDRKHLANDTVREVVRPLQVLLPGEFIHQVLPEG